MNKIRAKAVPATEKNYICLDEMLSSADMIPGCRSKFKLQPNWKGGVICLHELGYTKRDMPSEDDFIIKGAPENEPYFITVHGSLLVASSDDRIGGNPYCYPCVGNAEGFMFDAYTEPADEDCSFKMFENMDEFTRRDECTISGIYFVDSPGRIETWWDKYHEL